MAEPRRTIKSNTGQLAREFAARRLQLQLTQADLALLAGVGRSTVQALEGGKESLQLDGATAIADALGCDLRLVTRSGAFVEADGPA